MLFIMAVVFVPALLGTSQTVDPIGHFGYSGDVVLMRKLRQERL